MGFNELDTVVLDRDLPERSLLRGDLGVLVQLYGSEGLEAELVTASGRTQALVTLESRNFRALNGEDLITVGALIQGAA